MLNTSYSDHNYSCIPLYVCFFQKYESQADPLITRRFPNFPIHLLKNYTIAADLCLNLYFPILLQECAEFFSYSWRINQFSPLFRDGILALAPSLKRDFTVKILRTTIGRHDTGPGHLSASHDSRIYGSLHCDDVSAQVWCAVHPKLISKMYVGRVVKMETVNLISNEFQACSGGVK